HEWTRQRRVRRCPSRRSHSGRPCSTFPPAKEGDALEAQHAARTALDAFAARQAVAAIDGPAAPCMSAHVDANRAIVRTDAALHAPARLRHDLPFRQDLPAPNPL